METTSAKALQMSPTISEGRNRQLEHAALLIYEHIKLADQKALVFIGLNGGLIGGLYGIKILESPYIDWRLSIFAFLLLIIGMAFALLTIAPRRGDNKGKGVIDPWLIASFKNDDEYSKHLLELTDEAFMKQFTDRLFDLSTIDRRKYGCLKWAIFISAFAWLLSLVLALWHSWHPLVAAQS